MNELSLGPIGVFDSGYGGLTILTEIQKKLPDYDYIYLGDNSRAPYGSRSFDVVYEFTKQAVEFLFEKGCNLIILACNTASAKALRTIQQNDLPSINPDKRVLGIIRPTVEAIGRLTKTRHIGVVGTQGTIQSESYTMEVAKLYPDIVVNSHACPMWVPIVENKEFDGDGADFYVKKDLEDLFRLDDQIDTIILGCTHYPLLIDKIKAYTPKHIKLISQGEYIAESLSYYLERHSEIEKFCLRNKQTTYYTTESAFKFRESAAFFLNKEITVDRVNLGNK